MMKNLKSILIIILTLTLNTFFSQVVINEVMVNPAGGNTDGCIQSLANTNSSCGSEYVELYNTDPCNSFDLSCYVLGSTGFTAPNIGAVSLPSGTIIPPLGHLVIGGPNASSNAASVDIVVNNFAGTDNLCLAGTRWFLENQDGWVGLYAPDGTPIDAVYWTSGAGEQNKINTAIEFDRNVCAPNIACNQGVTFFGANQIGNIFYAGQSPSSGSTLSRIPDGGNWERNIAASINNTTVGNCNGGTCNTATPFTISALVNQPSCSNDDGSITINTNPAAGAYTYTWTPNVSATSSASNLAAGTYDVIIDLNGCQKDTSITLVAGNGPSGIVVTPTNPSCGQADGSISLGDVTGGTNPYTYNLNGAGFSGNLNYNNLAANTYTLVVQDANGCAYNAPNITLINSSGITSISVSVVDPSCGQSNGSVDLGAVTGGTGPYTYNFDGLGFSGQMNYPSLGAGTYPLVVQDNNGCLFNAPDVILTNGNGPSAIAVTSVDPSCGLTDGSISLGLVTGGVGPYQYNLGGNGLSANQIYNNLGAGSYTLIVEDVNGCTFSAPNIILSNGNGPSAISVNTTNPACGQNNGSITLGTVTGGTGPYTYNLNGAGFNAQLNYSNLASGSYSLIVQDDGGCIFNAPNIILSDLGGPTAIVITPSQTSCGLNNGAIQIGIVTGGTAPYQYDFNGQGFATNSLFNNLNPGTYSLVVRDNNGCTFSAQNTLINNSTTITNIQVNTTDASCSQNNGSVNLGVVTGGVNPYEYNFNNQGFSTTLNYLNIGSGTYPIVVRDNLGCTFNAQAIINDTGSPSGAQIDVLDASCGNTNGSISISNILGGSAPYQVSLNGLPFSQNLLFTNLNPGAYSIIIEDGNACQYTTQATISSSSNPLANFMFDSNQVSVIDPIVNTTNISSTDVVSFLWISNAASPSTSVEENPSFDFSNQEPGFYPVMLIVENSDGCKDTVINYLEFIEEPLVFVPNTFTPDGNEINNTWEIVANGIDIMDFNVLIFNRWGEIIWESNDASVGWDGTYNNRLVASGIYTWKISAKDKRRSTTLNYNGFVNVMY
jgi:gliding motility-associated-like protein